jgi:hypothetical protein
MNYPRRQQYRRLSRAGQLALTSAAVAVLGLYLAAISDPVGSHSSAW